MSVKEISANDLRSMGNSEGLILQGCGGSLDEWVDGINDLLTENGILLDGSRFTDVSSFEHNGVTCLLFPFSEDVKLDIGKLASWRLSAYEDFGGTWLSDYVPNQLGGFIARQEDDNILMDTTERKVENKMNDWNRLHRQAETIKELYPSGTRVLLLQMGDDPNPVENNMRGTVTAVDDIGTVFCKFDNGRSLGLISGEDSFRKLTAQELAEEQQQKMSEPAMEMSM